MMKISEACLLQPVENIAMSLRSEVIFQQLLKEMQPAISLMNPIDIMNLAQEARLIARLRLEVK